MFRTVNYCLRINRCIFLLVFASSIVTLTLLFNNYTPSCRVQLCTDSVTERTSVSAITDRLIQVALKPAQLAPSADDRILDELFLRRAFRVKLSEAQLAVLMSTVRVLTQAMDAFNVSYHMCGGTLVGSYLHHGPIPWDDDADLCVLKEDTRRVQDALKRLPRDFTFVKPAKQKRWKVFSTSNDTVAISGNDGRKLKWRGPFVDICFCDKDSAHIWDLSQPDTKRFPLSTVFPLSRRPFGELVLSAPRKTREYLLKNYSLDVCNAGWWSHMTETGISTVVSAPCKRLWPFYPFVFRTSYGANKRKEVLKVGNVTLNTLAIDALDSLIVV